MDDRTRLESWKEIAAHFGRRVRTVQRWERDEGLPVHRHGHLRRGTVHAFADELDAWRASRELGPDDAEPDAAVPSDTASAPAAEAPVAASARPVRGRPWALPAALSALALLFLAASLRAGARRAPPPPSDDADAALGARYLLHRDRPADVRRAMELCERGLAAAPRSAALHECLAHGYFLLTRAGALAPRDGFPKAKAAAERALALDPARPVARTVRAWTLHLFDWKSRDAERELRDVVEHGSPDAAALALPHHALASLLSAEGRHDEAIAELRAAQRTEPLSAALNDDGCWFFYRARRFPEALAEAARSLAIEPERLGARECVIDARAALGDLGGAKAEAVAVLRAVKDPAAASVDALEGAAALDAFRARLLARVEERSASEGRPVPPMPMTMLHASLGHADESVRWLERAVDARDPVVLLVRVHPYFDRVRADPRVAAALARAGV